MPDKTITEYWVGNKGSTPLWETKLTQFANGDILQEARACVVETGEWQPVDQNRFIELPPKEGWKNVTRQEAFKTFPICFPVLLLKKLAGVIFFLKQLRTLRIHQKQPDEVLEALIKDIEEGGD